MDQEQIRRLVKKIEAKVELYLKDETAEYLGLNAYDAIEAVLREELGGEISGSQS